MKNPKSFSIKSNFYLISIRICISILVEFYVAHLFQCVVESKICRNPFAFETIEVLNFLTLEQKEIDNIFSSLVAFIIRLQTHTWFNRACLNKIHIVPSLNNTVKQTKTKPLNIDICYNVNMRHPCLRALC